MLFRSFLLASTLNLIMAQRLVRRLCEKCRQEKRIDAALVKELAEEFDVDDILMVLQREGVVKKGVSWDDMVVYRPVGCKRCRDGYRGRVGIYEVMEVTPEIQALISPHTTSRSEEHTSELQSH